MNLICNDLFETYFSSQFFSNDILTEQERALTLNWSEKRVKEFSTGRYCAKKTLLSLGQPTTDILIGENREPLWPNHIVGSISHSNNLVGAIAAGNEKVKAIGLDIETIGKVGHDLWDLIFTSSEQNFLARFKGHQLDLYSTLLFSAKECFYKLQFPLTKTFIDFIDVEINIINNKMHLSFIKEFDSIDYNFTNLCLGYLVQDAELITFGYLI